MDALRQSLASAEKRDRARLGFQPRRVKHKKPEKHHTRIRRRKPEEWL